MPKLDRLKAELHFQKQLILAAFLAILMAVFLMLNTEAIGWPLIIWADIIISGSILLIVIKIRKIKDLLRGIEEC